MDLISAFMWYLGKMIIFLMVITSGCATVYWIFGEKKGAMHNTSAWGQGPYHRLVVTFSYLSCSYGVVCLSTVYAFQSEWLVGAVEGLEFHVLLLVVLAVAVLFTVQELTPYEEATTKFKTLTWLITSIAVGPAFLFLGPMVAGSSMTSSTALLVLAKLMAVAAPENLYLQLQAPIHFLYDMMALAALLAYLFTPPFNGLSVTLLSINFFGGIILYFLVCLTNFQHVLYVVKHDDQYDPIYNATVMMVSAVNLYLRISLYYMVELTDIMRDHPLPRTLKIQD